MHICLFAASEIVTSRNLNERENIIFRTKNKPTKWHSGVANGYSGFQEWPPRSPDLTPMDFFLWGYLKQQVYATPPPTLQDLQRRITDACANVAPAMPHHVQREVQARVHTCIVADGEKFERRK
ncbi:hypothetical protein AVEN_245212-1 [Araneus ventricosus]|uniref:Uncharacterized protein n=1 Tax=Araneus ventricosus TaxID=182803 RepID=A0A4Y2WSV7_ARAVE|nr:hypothetical protein AVEN_245212-1 [Araneus ventricosus]